MKRLLITAAALALLMTTAQAKPNNSYVDLKKAGVWTSYFVVSDKGNPMCGMGTYWFANGRQIGTVQVKYTAGNTVKVQMIKPSWRLADGAIVHVSVSFDAGEPQAVDAIAANTVDGPALTFTVNADATADFLHEFSESNKFTVAFPDGNEAPWDAKMEGSREVSTAFNQCSAYLDAHAPTQPTGKAATQPSGKPAPAPTAKKKDDGSI